MLIRVGVLGLALLGCVANSSNAQHFGAATAGCSECGSANVMSTTQQRGYEFQTAQLPAFSTAAQYVATPQTMMPVYSQQSAYAIQYQRQAQLEQVPVTSYRNVTVDRGSYQMVWVPKPVSQQVAQTTMQSRVSYRTVAVPVAQQSSSVAYVPTRSYAMATAPVYATQSPSMVFAQSTPTYSTPTYSTPSYSTAMIAADPGSYSGVAQDYPGLPLMPEVDAAYSGSDYSQSAQNVMQPTMTTGPALSFQESTGMDHAYESNIGPQSVDSQYQTVVPSQIQESGSPLLQLPERSSAARDYERPVTGRRSAKGLFEPVRSRSSVYSSRYTRSRRSR